MPGFALPDWMVRMRIADESLPAGLMLHAFARTEGAFPRMVEGRVLLIKGLEAAKG